MDENEIEDEQNAENESKDNDTPCPPGYHWDAATHSCVED